MLENRGTSFASSKIETTHISHKTPTISTIKYVFNPLAFCKIPSNILFNGREIFQ